MRDPVSMMVSDQETLDINLGPTLMCTHTCTHKHTFTLTYTYANKNLHMYKHHRHINMPKKDLHILVLVI